MEPLPSRLTLRLDIVQSLRCLVLQVFLDDGAGPNFGVDCRDETVELLHVQRGKFFGVHKLHGAEALEADENRFTFTQIQAVCHNNLSIANLAHMKVE